MLLVRFVLLLCLSLVSVAHTEQPAWHKVAYQPTNGKSLSALATSNTRCLHFSWTMHYAVKAAKIF